MKVKTNRVFAYIANSDGTREHLLKGVTQTITLMDTKCWVVTGVAKPSTHHSKLTT
jgi:hypothetical protein